MLPDTTCYKDSAGKVEELVGSFDEAEQVKNQKIICFGVQLLIATKLAGAILVTCVKELTDR